MTFAYNKNMAFPLLVAELTANVKIRTNASKKLGNLSEMVQEVLARREDTIDALDLIIGVAEKAKEIANTLDSADLPLGAVKQMVEFCEWIESCDGNCPGNLPAQYQKTPECIEEYIGIIKSTQHKDVCDWIEPRDWAERLGLSYNVIRMYDQKESQALLKVMNTAEFASLDQIKEHLWRHQDAFTLHRDFFLGSVYHNEASGKTTLFLLLLIYFDLIGRDEQHYGRILPRLDQKENSCHHRYALECCRIRYH